MTEEIDPEIQLLRDQLVRIRQRDIDDEQAKADCDAAAGDEWGRKFHQASADRKRAYRFEWETEPGASATG